MIHPNTKFFRAVSLMIGGIVGAGIFGLPYAFSQSGFAIGLLELLILGFFFLILQLMLAEVALATAGHHRLVNFVELYVGRPWKWVTLVCMSAAIWGSMLAYMIAGGEFLRLLFSGGEEQAIAYSFFVGIVASIVILGGLRFASRMEVGIVACLLVLFLALGLGSLPQVDFIHYFAFNPVQAFLPYGVILFALSGFGIVPELKDLLGAQAKRTLGPVIMISMGLIIALYAFFSFAVVGVTGPSTTPIAFEGLLALMGNDFGIFASLLGALTIFSIYSVLGVELLNTLKFDFSLSHRRAWFLTSCVPIILFAFGIREFIAIIGFVGGVFGGVLGILIALTYWNFRRSPVCRTHHCVRFPHVFTWGLIIIFAFGILLEIFNIIL